MILNGKDNSLDKYANIIGLLVFFSYIENYLLNTYI